PKIASFPSICYFSVTNMTADDTQLAPKGDVSHDMQIDRTSPVPIAYQLEIELRRQITQGELRPGQLLPTELALCRQLGLSRTPVRRALGRLAAAGLVVRTPGRGTHVATALPSPRAGAAV